MSHISDYKQASRLSRMLFFTSVQNSSQIESLQLHHLLSDSSSIETTLGDQTLTNNFILFANIIISDDFEENFLLAISNLMFVTPLPQKASRKIQLLEHEIALSS